MTAVRSAAAMLVLTTVLAAPASAATPTPAQPTPTGVTISGHGWGHGRGMGQWGALGYAARGLSSTQILNHYYGGTRSSQVGSPKISVELLRYAGRPVTLTGKSLKVNGRWVSGAVRVNRVSPGLLRVWRSDSCTGSFAEWFTAGSVAVSTAGSTSDPAAANQVCESSGTRGYRGSMRLFEGGGRFRMVNELSVENYLLGVVPRESPASWGDVAGGRGAQALRAQAVAARSYALASRRAHSTTCDTTACQVYGGWFRTGSGGRTMLEDSRTTRAVIATRGIARVRSGGRIAHTEFSSSTGGFTAGGAFPAVRDLGDSYPGNPVHNWSVDLDWATVQQRLGQGQLQSMVVLARTHVGKTPTRVTAVRLKRMDGSTVTLSGTSVRQRLALRSDWFSLRLR